MATFSSTLAATNRGLDLDLTDAWRETLKEYQKITGVSLMTTNSEPSFETIAKNIDDSITNSKSGNPAKAQRVIKHVIQCLQTLGSVLSQVASVAFGGATQCWNAINCILSAAQKYQEVIDGFTTLMEYSVVFLERLQHHLNNNRSTGEEFDKRLRKPTYKVMEHFLCVLANVHFNSLEHKGHKNWHRLKIILGIVLFNDDSGVKDNLTKMEGLIMDVTAQTVDVILQDVKGLARYIRESDDKIVSKQEEIDEHVEEVKEGVEKINETVESIKVDQDRQISDKDFKKDLERIKNSLGLNDVETRAKAHAEKVQHRLPGTGQWLLRDSTFQAWTDITNRGCATVYTLVGNQGFGKSFLTSHVIDRLHELYQTGPSTRRGVAVAYYYFSADKKDVEESVERCLGYLILQFANSSREYAKAVARVCEHRGSLGSADNIWTRLVEELKGYMSGTHFVVIDGFHKCGGDSSNEASRAEKAMDAIVKLALSSRDATTMQAKQSFRVFVAGQKEDLVPALRADDIAELELGPEGRFRIPSSQPPSTPYAEEVQEFTNAPDQVVRNENDLLIFARDRLTKLCEVKVDLKEVLQSPDLPAAKILSNGVKGDFINLQAKLDQIRNAESSDDVRTIVERATEDRNETLRRDVVSLNQTLTSNDKDELNGLLLWVWGIYESQSVKFFQAAFGNKKSWLHTHIVEKFNKLFTVDKGVVRLANLGIIGVIRKMDVAHDNEIQDYSDDESYAPLTSNEIKLVENVVRTFCGHELFDRFGFGNFFTIKRGEKVNRISIPSEDTVHARILRSSLERLCHSQDDAFYAPIRRYAAYWFAEHMNDIDLKQLSWEEQDHIGGQLATLLTDPTAIAAWWHDDFLETLIEDWVYQEAYTETLLAWLRSDRVSARFQSGPPEHLWLRGVLGSRREGDFPFSKVARYLADEWFGGIHANPLLFRSSFGLRAKASAIKFDRDTDPSVKEIHNFMTWARAQSNGDIPDQHWNVRLAETLCESGHYDECLDLASTLDSGDSNPWYFLLTQAKAFKGLEQCQRALDCLEQIQTQPEADVAELEYENALWDTIRLLTGQCHRALLQYVTAADCFKDILDHDFGGSYIHDAQWEAACAIFDMWKTNKSHEATIDLILSWEKSSSQSTDTDCWLGKLASLDDMHFCIVAAAPNTEHCERICEYYQTAINQLDPKEDPHRINTLRYYHATLLYHSSSPGIRRAKAIYALEKLLYATGDESINIWLARTITRKLSSYLLDDILATCQDSTPEIASHLTGKLERLSKASVPMLRDLRERDVDPTLTVARLKVKTGDTQGAREVLKEKMAFAMDNWPDVTDERELFERYRHLAHILTVLDDDHNARAAWQLLGPIRESPEEVPTTAEAETLNTEQDDSDLEGDATSGAIEGSDAEDITEIDDRHETPNTAPTTSQEAVESDNLEDLFSFLRYFCDGPLCTRVWYQAIEDCYVCKHCLEVQLCPSCHGSVKKGEMHQLVCNQHHEFLYVPRFDRKAWELMDPDMMVVDEKLVRKADWLHQLRREWGMQQEAINERKSRLKEKTLAVRVLTEAWVKILKKRGRATTESEEWAGLAPGDR